MNYDDPATAPSVPLQIDFDVDVSHSTASDTREFGVSPLPPFVERRYRIRLVGWDREKDIAVEYDIVARNLEGTVKHRPLFEHEKRWLERAGAR